MAENNRIMEEAQKKLVSYYVYIYSSFVLKLRLYLLHCFHRTHLAETSVIVSALFVQCDINFHLKNK